MSPFIQAIVRFLNQLGSSKDSVPEIPELEENNDDDLTPIPVRRVTPPPSVPPTTLTYTPPENKEAALSAPDVEQLTAQATQRQRIVHAMVLPSDNFRDWYEATREYTQAFPRTAIIRTPAGNNLNRYKVVSAVNAPRTWFNDDPLFHIRRAYPVVVSVDVINASTPAELKTILDERVRTNRRFGTDGNVFTRFTLDWMTDSYSLQIMRVFDEDVSGPYPNEGIDVATQPGVTVRAAVAGTVFNVVLDETNSLGYRAYVQIGSVGDDGTQYLVTYTNLAKIQVKERDIVREGNPIAVSSANTVKIVVQQEGVNTGSRYKIPGVIDPLRLLYVDRLKLYSTTSVPLNIRKGQGVQFDKVGELEVDEPAYTLELHGITIRKLNTTSADNKWVNLDTESGVTGYAAAWFLQARSPYSRLPTLNYNGVNVDVLNAQGKPAPARLGDMTYVRMPYNVSMGTGSQDLTQAFNVYAPYIDSLVNAGKQVILVYTHQTYGEGAGYVWPQMTSDRWRELSGRFSDFVRRIAQQYRGKIAAHQIWNEQDSRTGRASVPVPAADYAVILAGAIQAIRSVDPTTPIITGGHNSGPGNGSNYARVTLEAMPPGVRPDGIAAHPYGRGPDPSSKYAIFGHIDDSVQAYYDVLPGRPVWFTEWGVLNAPGEPAGEIRDYAVSFLNYLSDTHPDKVAATVWYGWSDTMDNGYGLVNSSGQAKEPLYSSYIEIE